MPDEFDNSRPPSLGPVVRGKQNESREPKWARFLEGVLIGLLAVIMLATACLVTVDFVLSLIPALQP